MVCSSNLWKGGYVDIYAWFILEWILSGWIKRECGFFVILSWDMKQVINKDS